MAATRPIGIYHEHQDWFRPLFAELDRRGTPYERIDARQHHYDADQQRRAAYSAGVQSHEPVGVPARPAGTASSTPRTTWPTWSSSACG